MQEKEAPAGDPERVTDDLGPLAWVFDELRQSLDGATKALRRFVRDCELARGSELAALDASPLRIARQQLHQAVGALEMVGMAVPAKVLRAMEALAQKFVQRPELCSVDAANKVERASFALTEYLEGFLKGKTASAVALFPQYRDVLLLLGDDRIHPADLWSIDFRWIDVALPHAAQALAYNAAGQVGLDGLILKLVKSADAVAAQALRDISLGFAATQSSLEPRAFWKICAAYFEAVSLGLCPDDVYGKRAASRILLQSRTLARAEGEISERLAQDLLFFCAQATPKQAGTASVLSAVRAAYGLTQSQAVDYETAQFGRFDPALLVQARKRIAAATETWSALAGGDTNRLKQAADQFGLVSESVLKLHPDSGDLVRALMRAIDITSRSGVAPAPALAMEVATVVLYLEAAYEDLDPTGSQMQARSASLAARLERVNAGAQPEPLEAWMQELYRRVSDRQIMGSVVDELRVTLAQVEKSLDLFFRNPTDKLPLHEVPKQLVQMRGVFSVLGLDQAALAALRLRDSIEKFLVDESDMTLAGTGDFEKLGNSLGALGFLIDMLSYQRELAKKLFVYDEALGEFKPLMGHGKAIEKTAVPEVSPDDLVSDAALALAPAPDALTDGPPVAPATVAASSVQTAADEQELKDIFLQEAHEVLQDGLAASQALAADPSDLSQQVTLRRSFHTLKGSARMVGLNEFGEAAWAMEQLLNSALAEQKSASNALIGLSTQALQGLARWVQDIASDADAASAWRAQAFRGSADGLRLANEVLELVLPGAPLPPPVAVDGADADSASIQPLDTGAAEPLEAAPTPAAVTADQAQALEVSVPPAAAPPPAAVNLVEPEPEEPVKVIDSLHVGLALYNVYLNEADEWSRRLQTELSEWALELHRPVSDSTLGLTHSLAGSSATVGFFALAEMARALEAALQHVQLHRQGRPEHASVFMAAAEDIRRLLHQFAAGFLKQPDQALLDALKAILEIQFPPVMEAVQEQGPDQAPAIESDVDQSLTAPLPPADREAPPAISADAPVGAAVPDSLDVDLFQVFEEEALELLPQLGGALRQWTARPDNLGARAEVLRVLHTLKGSARLAGAMHLGDQAHRLESAIEQMGSDALQAPQLETLLARFDAIHANFDALRATPVQALSLPEGALAANAEVPLTSAGATTVAAAAPVAMPLPPPLAAPRPVHRPTVRVRAQLLDRLVNQAGEVMITRSRMEARLGQLRGSLVELTANLDRLRRQLKDIELQSESQMQSRLTQAKDAAQEFDPLEFDRFTRVQELTRMMAESVHDLATIQRNLQAAVQGSEDDLVAQARQARELQHDLLRSRMLEFDSISERLYGVVRQAAKDLGKLVKLDIQGASLEMDRAVLDRMAPVFEHLLRNAVVHGIEDPALRAAAGKPTAGSISLVLHQQNNDVVVELRDDGGGLNFDRIRQQALANGLLTDAPALTDEEAVNLIFMPGFSTAAQVTELAGRGIGLDVVRAEVNALGGRIETSSARAQGTVFKLVLPLTTAVTQVVMLRLGEQVIGVPANLVELVRRVPAAQTDRAYQSQVFEFNGEQLPFFWAGSLLQASGHSREKAGKTLPVAIFRSAGQRLAAHIDEVLGNQEVVVKNLGPQLSRLPGLVGMSVLASGAVVLIYNPVALAAVYGERSRELAQTSLPSAGQDSRATTGLPAVVRQPPLVLVVDDSITVRRVTQRLLQREGFRVALAIDGLQALERLQEEKPAVVLSDIEMPRMDGFDLVRTIRGDAQLRDLPIILITSRSAHKHREHARELGVEHYLGKPYAEDELIGLVRHYCAQAQDS